MGNMLVDGDEAQRAEQAADGAARARSDRGVQRWAMADEDTAAGRAGMPSHLLDDVRVALRNADAVFAFLHGSRVTGTARADSDTDVAAWFAESPGAWWEIPLPDGVDLLVLNTAPLELSGRVALHGRLVYDDDPPLRISWQAQVRKQYLDERWRRQMANRVFLESHSGR